MKHAGKSKTIWVNALTALALINPKAVTWAAENPRLSLLSLISANILLRFLTKDKIQLRLSTAALASVMLLVPHVAFSFGSGRVSPDQVIAPILANDETGIVEGCGNQPVVGFTYCRQVEGDAANHSITFIGPPAKCDHADACVFIKVFNNQGILVWGGQIPKGETRIAVPWATLLGTGAFQIGHRGFWTFNMDVLWLDPDGKERQATTQGELVLRVYKAGYLPLNNVSADPNFVWAWVDNGLTYRMTSSLRAYVGRL